MTAMEGSSYETMAVVGVALTLCGIAFQDTVGASPSYALVLGGAALAAGAALATSTERGVGSRAFRL